MDSFNFQDIRAEKAKASSRYRKIQRLTTLFRLAELFVFLIVISKFSTQFASSAKLSAGEYLGGISLSALISPRFVFLVGNAIVVVLFVKSGRFSGKNNGEKINDNYYEEYVEKCRINNNNQQSCGKDPYDDVCYEERKTMNRSKSENLERTMMYHHGEENRPKLRRSVTERCRGRSSTKLEDEMSGEEFRRAVEAFIARQQRSLRGEEEDYSAVVSLTER